MPLVRAIAVLFLTLGFALGSAIGVAAATEQAFADPCPMHDQGSDCDGCKGGCSGAMMSCSAKCSVPFGAIALPYGNSYLRAGAEPLAAWGEAIYDPFVTGPPSPIPIA